MTLTPAFSLSRDAAGQLQLTTGDGQQFASIRPIRVFPLSAPDGCVSLVDESGSELLFLSTLHDLPDALRELIEDELAGRAFRPLLQRIVDIASLNDPSHWQVETDRGPTEFAVESEDDVHVLGGGRVLVIDTAGMRYLIPDVLQLDANSRRLLERFL